MIGIISYLPDNESLREIRKLNLIKVIELLKDLFPCEMINVIAQNFNYDDYLDDVNYIKFDKGIGPVKARNILLSMFYSSNDDYLYITDDDIVMYDYYDAKQFIRDLYFGKYNEYSIDLVTSLTPDFSPFKEIIFNDDYKHNHILKRASVTCGTPCALVKNFKKFYNKSIYYNENRYVNKGMVEDVDFISTLIYTGFSVYVCINWIRKLLNKDASTVFEGLITTRNDRINFTKMTLATICQYYGVSNIREFNKLYNKTQKKLYVKRPNEFSLPENLIPKTYKTRKILF